MARTLSNITQQFDRINEEKKEKSAPENCSRCQGLLVDDLCYSLLTSGISRMEIKRCVQCGDVIDSVIIQHRMQNPEAVYPVPLRQ